MNGSLDHVDELRAGPEFRWPGGKQIAVTYMVAYEAWSVGKTPGIGPMGNPLPAGVVDTNARSWGEYGSRRGIGRILDVLERTRTTAGVMVCGVLAETHPEIVRQIADAGHELIAHSYAMDVLPALLDVEEERANVTRTTELIQSVCGVAPRGWISPRGTPSPATSQLLAEAGYTWHGDALNDDLPSLLQFGDLEIVSVPFTMEVNDLPLHIRYGNPPRQMVEVFEDALSYLRRQSNEVAKIDVTVHAHVFGRPAGVWAYERIIEMVRGCEDVWVGTRAEIVSDFRAQIGRS